MATKYWIGSGSNTTFSATANWSDGAAPANSDTLIFSGSFGNGSATAGLNQSAVTGVTLIVEQSYTGSIGVLSGSTATYLQLSGPTCYLGKPTTQGSGSGSPLLMIDAGTSGTVNVMDSCATSGSTYYPPVLLKGTSLTASITGGTVGVGVLPGVTASGTFSVANGQVGLAPSLAIGPNTTIITSLTIADGTVANDSTITIPAVVQSGGTYTYTGTGAHTALTINNGACYYNGTGTVTAGTLYGVLDFSRDPRGKTVTDLTVRGGATLNIANGTPGGIAFTNAIQFPDGLDGVTLVTPHRIAFDINIGT